MVGSLAEQHAYFVPETETVARKLKTERIAVIGLGYVGLPVTVAFARRYANVIGFDIKETRVQELNRGCDRTEEIGSVDLLTSGADFTHDVSDIAKATFYVVAVPTPVDAGQRPDLSPLRKACQLLAPCLAKGDVVVFESTVFPGATEEVCIRELANHSDLVPGDDFHVAYSPERINPGDKVRGIEAVTKIVAAEDPEILERIARAYREIVPAGVHKTRSIKVAEAAKVFENTQRDVNIALTNEFARICDGIGIPTRDVLEATGTKWNALGFTPGLVGGHCIGVDPHYLTAKATEVGVYPELMLASRRTNDRVPADIALRAVRFLAARDIRPSEARVGILGATFKENVPDTRNSKVFDIVAGLRDHGLSPLVHDPVADAEDLRAEGIVSQTLETMQRLDLLILAVPHRHYLIGDGRFVQDMLRLGGVLMDIRSAIPTTGLRKDLTYWSL